jgi:hypothetical protein
VEESKMSEAHRGFSRRSFLGSVIVLPVLASALTVNAVADGSKVSKESMHYQTSPNGNMQCSGCRFFTPGSDAKSDGTCQIVDGAISPNGYCMAFAARS